MSITPELYEFITKVVEDKVKEIKVAREEFDKLVKTVEELSKKIDKMAEIQSETLRILEELAKAQRRTEERLNMLAEAQRRTEERLNMLAQRVDELAEAQRRTEERLNMLAQRVDELAEAQRRTEERLNMLAEAQKKTEESLSRLSNTVRELAIQVGRLSDTIGFGLEDIARVMIPGWLERHLGIYVEELVPRFFTIDGAEIQVNLFGVGKRDEKEVIVIGETKSRIYAREVEKFARTLELLKKFFKDKEILGVIFGYLIHPSAEEEAKKYGIKLIATYMR